MGGWDVVPGMGERASEGKGEKQKRGWERGRSIPEPNTCRGRCRQASGIAVANARTYQHTDARAHTEGHSV